MFQLFCGGWAKTHFLEFRDDIDIYKFIPNTFFFKFRQPSPQPQRKAFEAQAEKRSDSGFGIANIMTDLLKYVGGENGSWYFSYPQKLKV